MRLATISLAVNASLAQTTLAAATTYTYTTLGIPGADLRYGSFAEDIDNKGRVVLMTGDIYGGLNGYVLNLATGSLSLLTTPSATTGLLPRAINDAGQIVGNLATISIGRPSTGSAFLLDPATGSLSTNFPFSLNPNGINDGGQIVGSLVTLPGRGSSAMTAKGYSSNVATGVSTTFVDPFGPTYTTADGINEAGTIVGSYSAAPNASTAVYHGYVRDPVSGAFTTIDSPLGDSTSLSAINDAGQIVGAATLGFSFPIGFVLDVATNTYSALTIPGAFGVSPFGINDADQVVGFYRAAAGLQAFLATPETTGEPTGVPEPWSLALLTSGLVAICVRHALSGSASPRWAQATSVASIG